MIPRTINTLRARHAPLRLTCAILIGAMSAILLLVGCGSDPPPEPTPTPIDVAALVARSGEAMAALDTFHFELRHNEGGSTPLFGVIVMNEAGGDVVSPDSASVYFNGTFAGFTVRSSLITIGEDSYITNPLTGAWEPAGDDVNPLTFFDPQRGINSIMAELQNPALVSESDAGYEIEGKLPATALSSLLGGMMEGATVNARLTIDTDSLFLKQAILEGRLTESEPDGVVRTITLSNFNEQVTIEPPI